MQMTENRANLPQFTNLERATAVADLLDAEPSSQGYIVKGAAHPRETVYRSPKAQVNAASINDIKDAVKVLIQAKVETLNGLQNVFPVESSCGGAQLFMERINIDFANMLRYNTMNASNYVGCFFTHPSRETRVPVSIRYYKTSGGKCQYQYFFNDLNGIFGTEIAAQIADHRKLLRAAITKHDELITTINETLKLTVDEIAAINEQFGVPVVQ